MKAMILAAGFGQRMRPLTEKTPKPLLEIAGKPMIFYHLEALSEAGIEDVVVNVSHLGDQVEAALGDGSQWGLRIEYSRENEPLETAGGIIQALPVLGSGPFLVVNGDIFTDFPVANLVGKPLPENCVAHLVMVPNPEHHSGGDFRLAEDGLLGWASAAGEKLTYAGIGVYSPEFFVGLNPGRLPLRPLFDMAIATGQLRGEAYQGNWHDIGTPERLDEIDKRYSVEY